MKITKHISTQSLPRLIIINGQLDDMKYVDIGLSLSKIIESSLNSKHLALEANDAIDTIIKDNVLHNKDIGNYIALCNIGILFEPALHLDLHNKFRTLSKSLTLIINDNECSINNNIFYLANTNNKSYSINLSDIPYNIIYL
ncbi:MAG: hypothetical protein IJA42_08140 [Bacteroidales bacterium]|nr:hypothetical protein [Bacteroidales bacterium]